MSIPVAFNTINEQAGVKREFDFDTAPEDMHILYYIARNQLYSDELTALLREYGINAMDIHIATGQAERPIQVTLPTQLDPFLKIRDFGTGLDEQGVKEYVSFGKSSKRGDPNQTGQLGIGCKCGFTYGDSFIVNSYQNGSMTSWNAYIDPSNKGKIAEMVTCPNDAPDGVEIVVPIKSGDVSKCHEKAMFLFSFAKVVPKFVNATQEDLASLNRKRAETPLYQGKGWRYYGSGEAYAVMGNIPYPINASNFTELELRDEARQLLDGKLILECAMDELDFAASRENLKYTPKTKKNIAARMTDVANELMAQASTTFDGCKSLWDAKLLYKQVFDYYGKLYSLRNLFNRHLTFNGFAINSDTFSTTLTGGADTDVVCWAYSKSYGSKIRRQQVYNIKADPKCLVVENDAAICNGILNRLVGQIEAGNQYETVYLLSFTNPAIKQQWLAEVGLDCPIVPLSTLPKEPLSKYYPNTSACGNGYRNTKHVSKEFTYNGDGKSRYHDTRSSFWEVADVDLKNDEGVYVAISKFHVSLGDGTGWQHPVELRRFLAKVKEAGIDTPDTIYGFKPSAVAKASQNPKMLTFWQWFKIAVQEYLQNNPQIAQDFANREYVCNTLNGLHPDLRTFCHEVIKWPSLPDPHPIRELSKKVDELCSYKAGQLDRLGEMCAKINHQYQGTPVHDVRQEVEALTKRYPLLFQVAARIGAYHLEDDNWQPALEQYITLIDATTP